VGDIDHQRLRRVLGDPELEWLLERIRRRLELGNPLDGPVTLAHASPAQRAAVERLFGRPARSGRGLSVPLGELDRLVRHAGLHADGLAAAVVALTGRVCVRADVEAEQSAAWSAAFASLERHAAGRPPLAAWAAQLRRSGQVKRLTPTAREASDLLAELVSVLRALPADGESLGTFAASTTGGGAHALDDGRPLGTLALGAARALAGLDAPGPDESAAEARREAWAAVGVLCDELSSTVLVLGLPGEATVTGRLLALARSDGQPLWLTLRQVARDLPCWSEALGRVFVCENPSVVALAADRLGGTCPPLVCTNGQPSAATMVLLRALHDTGVQLMYHGDFDWGGVRIGNVMHRRLGTVPWQFDDVAYRVAVEHHVHAPVLTGTPVAAAWDLDLTASMERVRRQIEEELIAEELLEGLAES
jgi:uncharacterized protein (TIGR02679 family)